MKQLMNYSMFLSLFVFAATASFAKTVNGKGTETTAVDKTSQPASLNVTTSVFADELSAYQAPSYNIYTSNIFADDVFTDDINNGDVLIADLITTNPNTVDINTVDANNNTNVDLSANPSNGTISIKTECLGKLYYYTEPHTDKDGNIINGGQNVLYVQKILSPGVFSCTYVGPDGSTKEVKVVCKK